MLCFRVYSGVAVGCTGPTRAIVVRASRNVLVKEEIGEIEAKHSISSPKRIPILNVQSAIVNARKPYEIEPLVI